MENGTLLYLNHVELQDINYDRLILYFLLFLLYISFNFYRISQVVEPYRCIFKNNNHEITCTYMHTFLRIQLRIRNILCCLIFSFSTRLLT